MAYSTVEVEGIQHDNLIPVYTYCEMIAKVGLLNTSITSHHIVSFLQGEHLRSTNSATFNYTTRVDWSDYAGTTVNSQMRNLTVRKFE